MSTSTIDKDEIKALTRALKEKKALADQITDAFEVKSDGTVVVDEAKQAAFVKAFTEAQQIQQLLYAKTGFTQMDAYLNGVDGEPAARAANQPGTEYKSVGQRMLESEAWQGYKGASYRHGVTFSGPGSWWADIDQDPAGQKDVWSLSAGTYTAQGFGSQHQRPIVEQLPRRTHLRDLFPPETTTAAMIYGIRQTGFTNNARPVRERSAADGVSAPVGNDTDTFGLAPKSKITFETVVYPMAEIAHVDYIHKTVLEDEPRLRGVVDRNMREGVRKAEDNQILNGDGANPNMRGILQTTGVQTYNQPLDDATPAAPTEKKTTTLRRAITRVQLAEMDATGVVINPVDWEDMELEEDGNGRLTLVTSIATGADTRVWRLPVVATTAMPQGRYLLGAFGLGCQLFDRRELAIEISTENRDQFERGAITVRASERMALTVDRPEAFVTGTLYVPA
ncbi:phage major capsid protein [Micromonospora haikouensis]|uniref:phage major capsid protein n=1 Tax=Micromonospora haikouensis TaxID=686309 RepID=UPI003D750137